MTEPRQALRRLRQRPATTAAAVLVLSGSIGATVVGWALLSATLLNPLPVRDPDTLFVVGTTSVKGQRAGAFDSGFTYPWYAWLRANGRFTSVTAEWGDLVRTRIGPAGASSVSASFVSHTYFDVLGVNVVLGRSFSKEEDQRGAAATAVLSNAYWRRAFNASSTVLGETLLVNGKTAVVVGVAESGFRGLVLDSTPDLFFPLETIGDLTELELNYFDDPVHHSSAVAGLKIIARTSGREGSESFTAHLNRVGGPPGVALDGRLALSPVSVEAIPSLSRTSLRHFASVLATGVASILLVGCITVGFLLLVRTQARSDELAVCLALGATRRRLVLGTAIEGAVMVFGAAVLAVPAAWWFIAGLQAFQLPGRVDISSLELTVTSAAITAALTTSLLAASVLTITGGSLGLLLSGRGQRMLSVRNKPMTRSAAVLIIIQLAAAFVLLAGATVFLRSVVNALAINTNTALEKILTGRLLLPQEYGDVQKNEFVESFRREMNANLGVQSVAVSQLLAMTGELRVDDAPLRLGSPATIVAVDQAFFETMQLTLRAGRDFSSVDSEGAPLVGIVSESLAKSFRRQGTDGRVVTLPFGRPAASVRVVGTVSDLVTVITRLEPAVLYVPIRQHKSRGRINVGIRCESVGAIRGHVLTTIKRMDCSAAVEGLLTLREQIARQVAPQRFAARLLTILGTIALLLTAIGSYVLAETMATLRMREMGIRAALGATKLQLAMMTLARTGRLVGVGVVLGGSCTWLGSSAVRTLSFKVELLDPVSILAVTGTICVVTICASVQPALRASRVDVAGVLRHE
jgi:predicted permease